MRSRSGFTVVEILVSLAVISTLMAMILPAVQSSRAQVRMVQCRNNLHQHGVSIHHLEATHRYIRTDESLNELLEANPPANAAEMAAANYPLAICPDDPIASISRGHSPNYLFNVGNERQAGRRRNGIIGWTRAAEVTDGLSQTALLSERLVPPISFDPHSFDDDPLRWPGFTPNPQPHPSGIDRFAELCRTQRSTPLIWQGTLPVVYFSGADFYTHVLGPNANSCINGTPNSTTLDYDSSMIIFSPTSLHRGGIHLLLCDGSVRFVSDHIDLNIWQAIGSRNGNEVVGEW